MSVVPAVSRRGRRHVTAYSVWVVSSRKKRGKGDLNTSSVVRGIATCVRSLAGVFRCPASSDETHKTQHGLFCWAAIGEDGGERRFPHLLRQRQSLFEQGGISLGSGTVTTKRRCVERLQLRCALVSVILLQEETQDRWSGRHFGLEIGEENKKQARN